MRPYIYSLIVTREETLTYTAICIVINPVPSLDIFVIYCVFFRFFRSANIGLDFCFYFFCFFNQLLLFLIHVHFHFFSPLSCSCKGFSFSFRNIFSLVSHIDFRVVIFLPSRFNRFTLHFCGLFSLSFIRINCLGLKRTEDVRLLIGVCLAALGFALLQFRMNKATIRIKSDLLTTSSFCNVRFVYFALDVIQIDDFVVIIRIT